MLPKTSVYVKSYDGQTKWMYVFIEDDNVLKKNNTIQDKVNSGIKNQFGSEPEKFFENQNKISQQ